MRCDFVPQPANALGNGIGTDPGVGGAEDEVDVVAQGVPVGFQFVDDLPGRPENRLLAQFLDVTCVEALDERFQERGVGVLVGDELTERGQR